MMDSRNIRFVQDSFEKIAAPGEQIVEIFYAELFAIDPSLEAMFPNEPGEQRETMLAKMAMLVRSLHMPVKIKEIVEELAASHLEYGVRPAHYTHVGNALLRTLKKGLGADFTPELCDAWTEAFRMLAQAIKETTYGRASTPFAAVS